MKRNHLNLNCLYITNDGDALSGTLPYKLSVPRIPIYRERVSVFLNPFQEPRISVHHVSLPWGSDIDQRSPIFAPTLSRYQGLKIIHST